MTTTTNLQASATTTTATTINSTTTNITKYVHWAAIPHSRSHSLPQPRPSPALPALPSIWFHPDPSAPRNHRVTGFWSKNDSQLSPSLVYKESTKHSPVHRLHRETGHGIDRLGLVVFHLERFQSGQTHRVLQHPHTRPVRLLWRSETETEIREG